MIGLQAVEKLRDTEQEYFIISFVLGNSGGLYLLVIRLLIQHVYKCSWR